MSSTPRITGLIDSATSDWRAQVYGLVNPPVTAIYSVIQIGSLWWYSKALNAGPNSTTIFVGSWPDQTTATDMMNQARIIDGF
jgi:hypothetical protein